jgi:hypothetical protein
VEYIFENNIGNGTLTDGSEQSITRAQQSCLCVGCARHQDEGRSTVFNRKPGWTIVNFSRGTDHCSNETVNRIESDQIDRSAQRFFSRSFHGSTVQRQTVRAECGCTNSTVFVVTEKTRINPHHSPPTTPSLPGGGQVAQVRHVRASNSTVT